ncbi:hypothetical protein [Streptomyces albireticuli]|uniref:Uncharacterized protein n=1 Tax=Streptomyces albireticuli TaxID=1940 RepID=A0A2A2D1Q7_9ACTN|nr:hypothetical protein [Streptomyces albireticuli]MCD9142805.1 hypothetical protein [Streptomyces albireticuli]MCD9162876.1 hypothetical protein [Streptomyces albireticuli]MCD9192436.1 hypothetical protein [Streptomyces albireticuli]PAU46363.1 hypothetical protein CK936_24580 [Streptomyces albireticuli]
MTPGSGAAGFEAVGSGTVRSGAVRSDSVRPGAVRSDVADSGDSGSGPDGSDASDASDGSDISGGDHAPVVAIGVGRRRRLGRRWRPVEVGVAMALAGCALGGVAVAAGTGVLPAPFKRSSGEPAAGASVSALENGGAGTTEPGAPGSTPSRGEDGGPRESGRPSASATPGAETGAGHGGGRNAGPGASPSETPRHHDGGTREDRDGDGRDGDRNDDRDDRKDDGKETDAGKNATTLAARLCRDYLAAQQRRGDAVDENDIRTLERSAGAGAAAIRKYCEKLLDGGGGLGGLRNLPAKGGVTGTASGLGGAPQAPVLPLPLPVPGVPVGAGGSEARGT